MRRATRSRWGCHAVLSITVPPCHASPFVARVAGATAARTDPGSRSGQLTPARNHRLRPCRRNHIAGASDRRRGGEQPWTAPHPRTPAGGDRTVGHDGGRRCRRAGHIVWVGRRQRHIWHRAKAEDVDDGALWVPHRQLRRPGGGAYALGVPRMRARETAVLRRASAPVCVLRGRPPPASGRRRQCP